MTQNFDSFKNKTFDLLVIGGGINGAAIANIASRHGLSVCLVEKGDFAGGTSSKSSKLVHGGIRYLENFEFKLVGEALKERAIHLKEVPYLVKPMPFLIPVYKGDKRPLWMMKIGVLLYNLLAGKNNIGPYKSFSAPELLKEEPSLNPEGLVGGVQYFDAQMDDARLCLENILAAKSKGAETLNYTEVTQLLKENGRTVGVRVKDVLNTGSKEAELRAKKIIAAVGPWSNSILKMDNPEAPDCVRTTKGIHIVYPERISKKALLIPSHRDNRIFFVIPWQEDNTLIGTTDTDFKGNPDQVAADESDIRYLMEEARRVFPGLPLSSENTITFAGLRPLIRSSADTPSKATREHSIFETASGIIYVTGGKYTTYRIVAEETLSRVISIQKDGKYPLYGSGVINDTREQAGAKYGVDAEIAGALMEKYGTRYSDVLKLTIDDPKLKEKICPHASVIRAQIVYSIRAEMARCPEDIITRRLLLGYNACVMKQCKEVMDKTVSEYL